MDGNQRSKLYLNIIENRSVLLRAFNCKSYLDLYAYFNKIKPYDKANRKDPHWKSFFYNQGLDDGIRSAMIEVVFEELRARLADGNIKLSGTDQRVIGQILSPDEQPTEAIPIQSDVSFRPRRSGRQTDSVILTNLLRVWKEGSGLDRPPLKMAIYQVYRRYKPRRHADLSERQNTPEHYVIVELILVLPTTREAIYITGNRDIYTGALFISAEAKILSVMLHSATPNLGKVDLQYLALKLEDDRRVLRDDGSLPFYSGILVSTGDSDSDGKPISSECIFVTIPLKQNQELYQELIELRKHISNVGATGRRYRINDGNEISKYLVSAPTPLRMRPTINQAQAGASSEGRLKKLKYFPALCYMAKQNDEGITFLREPSRTISPGNINMIADQFPIGVFKASK